MINHFPSLLRIVSCVACVAVTLVCARVVVADAWTISGHAFPHVQAVAVDRSGNSLSVLISLELDDTGSSQNSLRIGMLDSDSREAASEVILDRYLDLKTPVSFYSDSLSGRYVITHDDNDGTVIHLFDGTGRQIDERYVDFGESGVINISEHARELLYTTNQGIYRLDENSEPASLYRVSTTERISSFHKTDDKDCHTAVIVRNTGISTWDLRVLCDSDNGLVVGKRASGSSSILPGVFTRIVWSSLLPDKFWVVGPNEQSSIEIAVCNLSIGADCESTPMKLVNPGRPLIATRFPITMISHQIAATVTATNETSSLLLYDLDGNQLSKHDLRWFDADSSAVGSRQISASAILTANGLVWPLVQTVSIPTSDPEEFKSSGYVFNIATRPFSIDSKSGQITPISDVGGD